MDYRTLGRSGCSVSSFCLGTMTFGVETDEQGAHRQLDRFVEAGGTLVDTADVYGDGRSEEIIGRWFASRPAQVTEPVVLATKGRFPLDDSPNGAGLSARHLTRALEASLRRLEVEAVDLYQVHAFDPWKALEETLRALDGLVRAGGKNPLARPVELHGLAVDEGVAPGPRAERRRAGDASAAVQPAGTGDRVGDRARGDGRGPRAAAMEPARRRLAVGQVQARRAADRRHPPGRGPESRHGGIRPARDAAHLGGHRRGAEDRGRTRCVDGRGRPGVGDGSAGGHVDDSRGPHARTA